MVRVPPGGSAREDLLQALRLLEEFISCACEALGFCRLPVLAAWLSSLHGSLLFKAIRSMPAQHRPRSSCKARPTWILSLLTISKPFDSGLYLCRIPLASIRFKGDILSLLLFLCLEARSQVLPSVKSVAHWQSSCSVPATVSSMDGSSLVNTHTDGQEESSSLQQTPVSKCGRKEGRKGSPLANTVVMTMQTRLSNG